MTTAHTPTLPPQPELVLTAPATALAQVLRREAKRHGLQVHSGWADDGEAVDALAQAHAWPLQSHQVLVHELGGDAHAPLVLLAEAWARRAQRLQVPLVLLVPVGAALDADRERRLALAEAVAVRCCPTALPLRLPQQGAAAQAAALAPLWPLLGAAPVPPAAAQAPLTPPLRSADELLTEALRTAEAAFQSPGSHPAERLREAIEQAGWGERIATRLAMLSRRTARPDAPETGPAPLGPR